MAITLPDSVKTQIKDGLAASMEQPNTNADDARCLGCGKTFSGQRGLIAHQSSKFVAMGCKPIRRKAVG